MMLIEKIKELPYFEDWCWIDEMHVTHPYQTKLMEIFCKRKVSYVIGQNGARTVKINFDDGSEDAVISTICNLIKFFEGE